MNRKWIAVANITVTVFIVGFVIIYSHFETRSAYLRQVENFKDTTISMERVTENYLSGEQGICNVWAHFINAHEMTLEEAAEFIRSCHVLETTSAHIIYADTLEGLSTRPGPGSPESFDVSYRSIDILSSMDWISDEPRAINITRAYTNPMNGEQALAFVNRVTVRSEEGSPREALVLRVVPMAVLEQKWVFPQEEFESAELSMIDSSGNYIIRGKTFKNSNFFEFYKSYNRYDAETLRRLTEAVVGTAGTFSMRDSRGHENVIAYTPITSTSGWSLLGLVSEEELMTGIEDWTLVGVVCSCLLFLFLLDYLYMRAINRNLKQMADAAASASRAKTDFLSTMSHDIRTPMNAIIGLTTIAERNIGDTALVRDCLRKISLASNHLLTLINDILDISKVESGKLTLSPITFSIAETVENLVNISQPMIREKNLEFSFRINRMEKEYLYADQLRLNQICINILSNAIKYTPADGSVTVDMREDESPEPGCVRLTYRVADTGIGMTPEYMEKMYQPFSRQTDSRVNTIQGTGLGLAITKQMVDLMHGTIDCTSEPGRGTTFTVVLDIPVAQQQIENLQLDPIDVLIVDDDEILLETAVDTLESLGVSAERADSGLTALGMIRHRQETGKNYDIVIIDWKMPCMDGIETVRRIRSEIDARIPVLIVSAYDWTEIEDEARAAGANGFISKPLFRSTLYEKISELLGIQSAAVEPADDFADIAGLNILVAEDNDINWEIISAMLAMYGITSERAVNGKRCLERMEQAKEGEFALIFMDVQMPEMNGLDATRAIRKLESPWASGIPIIAMTADAFSENVTECLDAGMNGHIAKPVDIKLVMREIQRIHREASK